MYLLFRYENGGYVISSADGEWSREMTSNEGQELLSRWPREIDTAFRQILLDAQGPRFIVS